MVFNKLILVAAALTLLIKGGDTQLSVCGQPALNTRIVGGATAPQGSWPWQVSLHTSSRHFCGGSLINEQWVLSAAHCFQKNIGSPSDVTAYLGRQSQEGSNPNEVSRTVTRIINHPDYNSKTSNNDISLLKLSEPVSFTSYISPVCLAASGSIFTSGVDSWVTGWGTIGSGVSLPFPQNLMEVEVPVVGNSQCNSNYGGVITDNMICAGLLEGGKDSCQGDSGGPMVSKQCGRWIQAGIVSFGEGCAKPNFPGVYARVSQYESWIKSLISTNQPGFISFTPSVSCTSKPVCGRAPLSSRILNGSSVASAGEWPWMASVQKNGQHVCGGTLVSEIYVLTDASCFSGSPVVSEWTVVLGRLNQNGSNPFETSLKVANITLSNLTGNNVALLGLASRPTLTDFIQPICLGTGRTFGVGLVCWAAGWSSGRGGEKQALQQFQATVRDCVNASSNDVLCTESFTLEKGDYGGPLMCQQEGSWFQAAVLQLVNASTRMERDDSLMIFDKLDRYESFLSRLLGTFLSPASNGGISISHSAFLLLGHFLLHVLCIKVFT